MTLIFLMLSNFFSLSIFPKTSLSFLTIQHQMITKSNLLIINEERDSVLFTKEWERWYEWLKDYFNITLVNVNDILFQDNSHDTNIFIKQWKDFVDIESFNFQAVIPFLTYDFNDFIFTMLDAFEKKWIFVLNKKVFGKFTKINGYRLLKEIGYGHRIIPNYFWFNGDSFHLSVLKWLFEKTQWKFLMKWNDWYGWEFVLNQDMFLKSSRKSSYKKSAWVFQKYIENNGDIRVLVAGDWVFAYKRKRVDTKSLVNNISQWWVRESFDIPQSMKEEVLDITKKLWWDYLGFDYILDEKTQEWYILELNETAMGTKGLIESFGVNPYTHLAEHIYTQISN